MSALTTRDVGASQLDVALQRRARRNKFAIDARGEFEPDPVADARNRLAQLEADRLLVEADAREEEELEVTLAAARPQASEALIEAAAVYASARVALDNALAVAHAQATKAADAKVAYTRALQVARKLDAMGDHVAISGSFGAVARELLMKVQAV